MEVTVEKREGWIKDFPGKLCGKVGEFLKKAKKLAVEDPRRVIHSLKVGLAITLVSLIYYFQPLYEGFGVSAMWAVLSVVVVFEFSVGATLGRGVNRGLATFLAATLAFGAHHLATLFGERVEPILLGLFVFLLASGVTFLRFFPRMKARYDYGLLIFILTFCLVSVSGYRDDEVLDMAHRRVSTILIGGFTALIVCIFICPVWAGDDLHNSVAGNVEKLGSFLECFVVEYFRVSGHGESMEVSTQGYRSILNSKQSEETLANFARWEPRHGRFRFRHPWKQYLKIGNLTRQCAYRLEALNSYLDNEVQTSQEFSNKIEETCTKMSLESARALKELALAIKTMTRPSTSSVHVAKSKIAATNLKCLLKTSVSEGTDLLEIIPVATVASLLVDVVTCTERIAESINELASLAKFKKSVEPQVVAQKSTVLRQKTMQQQTNLNGPGPHHVITIDHQSSPKKSVECQVPLEKSKLARQVTMQKCSSLNVNRRHHNVVAVESAAISSVGTE